MKRRETEYEILKKPKGSSGSIFSEVEYSSQKIIDFQNIGVRHLFFILIEK